MGEEHKSYQCVICGCSLLFTSNLFDPPEEEFIVPSPQGGSLSATPRVRMGSGLFDDECLTDQFESPCISPNRSQSCSFTENKICQPNEMKEQIQSLIIVSNPQSKIPITPRKQTKFSPPQKKRPLKTISSFSQSTQTTLSETDNTPLYFRSTRSNSNERTKTNDSSQDKKVIDSYDIPKYPVGLVEPTIEYCNRWGIEFPICSKCFLLVDSALAENLSMLSSDFRKQRIKYQELIEYLITETLIEDINKELRAIDQLTSEVTTLQIENVRLKQIEGTIKQCKIVENSVHAQHCKELNLLSFYGMYSFKSFHIPQNTRLMRIERFLSSSSAVDHLFHIKWLEDDVSINGIQLVQTIKSKNQQKFKLVIDVIIKMFQVIEREFKLNPLQVPNIIVKKPDIIFAYCLLSLERFLIYISNTNKNVVIPYPTEMSEKKIGKVQFIPVCLNESYDMFVIAIKFFLTDIKLLIDYVASPSHQEQEVFVN